MKPAYLYRAVVKRIIDGDTIRVDWDLGAHVTLKDQPLRLLGLNAPELRGPTRPAGIAARNWLAARLPVGSEIVIHTVKDDAFGRYLAWVWVGFDLINEEMIAAGHAVRRDLEGATSAQEVGNG